MIQWHLETRKLKDLKPHPKNPRSLSKDQARQLRKSIETHGLSDKPIINTDNTIIGGHQRVSVLKSMGWKEVECQLPDRTLTEEEVEEKMLRLNRNHGDFDYDILANNFEVPYLIDIGFGIEELELIDPEELPSNKDKKKKLTTCPKCGYEFG